MRKPTKHTAKNGTVSYKVRYRDSSKTFYGPTAKKDADEFAGLCASIGPDKAIAYLRNKYAVEDGDEATPTLDAWAERYRASRTAVTDGTRHGYERTYALSFQPLIGSLPLDLITHERIATAVNALSTKGGKAKTGYSDKTIANAHGLLSAMLKEAVAEGIIKSNPCERIKLARKTSHKSAKMFLFTHDEFANLVDHIPEHYRPLVLTLGGTGIRWGEAEALEVRDFDAEMRTLRIDKAAKWDTSKAQRDVGPTKTRMSDRTVTLPDVVVAELATLTKGRRRNERLFLAPRGGPLRHKSFWQEAWVPSCEHKEVNLIDPRPRIHDLRHAHASWLIAQGVPLPVIQARLGHNSIKVTVDTYGHLSPDIQRAAADAANLSLGGMRALGS